MRSSINEAYYNHRPKLLCRLLVLATTAVSLLIHVDAVITGSEVKSSSSRNESSSIASSSCQLIPTRFRTNNNVNPLALANSKPVFSWAIGFRKDVDGHNKYDDSLYSDPPPGEELGVNHYQSAYRLTCTEIIGNGTRRRLLWDTGKVYDSETLQIEYDGVPLQSLQHIQWHVEMWDEHDYKCFSSSAKDDDDPWFETGLLDESAWGDSEWIARPGQSSLPANTSLCDMMSASEENQVPRFRSVLSNMPTSVIEARAYISGLGYYELNINGTKVGDSMLDPGWTTYSKRVLYSAYDITSLLPFSQITSGGDVVVTVELGNGWWNPLPLLMFGRWNLRDELMTGQNLSSSRPMFRLRIIGIQSDGSILSLLDSKAATVSPIGGQTTAAMGQSSWVASGSPTIFNNIYLGEKYDARLESNFKGWKTNVQYNLTNINETVWQPVVKADTSWLGRLEAQEVPPIRKQKWLSSKLVSNKTHPISPNKTISIIDTGINHAGSCRIQIKKPQRHDLVESLFGETIRMRYGELLHQDGTLNAMTSVAGQIKGTNSKSPCQPEVAYQSDTIIVGSHDVDWTPKWSWHGFRYIEVTAPSILSFDNDDITIDCFTMRTDVDTVFNFSSSNDWLSNDLRQLVKNTYDSNLMSVQSDCPHRERFGYGGDALGCGEAGMSIYDFSAFYRKRVLDYNDAQISLNSSPSDASPMALQGFTETAPFVGIASAGLGPKTGPIGWEAFQPEAQLWLYKYYGDSQTMRESFEHTRAYIDLLDRQPTGIENGLGDWMAVDRTDVAFTGLGFQYSSYLAFANITEILGMPSNLTSQYRQKAAAIADTINARFMDMNGSYRVGTGKRSGNITQAGQGMALFFGFLSQDPSSRRKALLRLIENANSSSHIQGACRPATRKSYFLSPDCAHSEGGPGPHITAGLFGIKWVLMALADAGMNDLAYDMVTTKTYPSLGWMMDNPFSNATTIWESFSFSDGTYSHNHPMFSSTEVWLLQTIAGIQPHPAAKGMDHILIKPNPPNQLQSVSASYESPRGITRVSWKQFSSSSHHGYSFELNVTIPPNCKATVSIPAMEVSTLLLHNKALVLNATWIPSLLNDNRHNGSMAIEIGSGRHQFLSVSVEDTMVPDLQT